MEKNRLYNRFKASHSTNKELVRPIKLDNFSQHSCYARSLFFFVCFFIVVWSVLFGVLCFFFPPRQSGMQIRRAIADWFPHCNPQQ